MMNLHQLISTAKGLGLGVSLLSTYLQTTNYLQRYQDTVVVALLKTYTLPIP